MELLTPTAPLVDRNSGKGSAILSEPVTKLAIDPRITAFQTRNRARGIAVPRTIAVLQIDIVTIHHQIPKKQLKSSSITDH